MIKEEKACGIYGIKNTRNGKLYIGKSVDIDKRWSVWMCSFRLGKIQNPVMMKEWDVKVFLFYVIEECEKNKLQEREMFWMKIFDTLNPEKGYNIRKNGYSK